MSNYQKGKASSSAHLGWLRRRRLLYWQSRLSARTLCPCRWMGCCWLTVLLPLSSEVPLTKLAPGLTYWTPPPRPRTDLRFATTHTRAHANADRPTKQRTLTPFKELTSIYIVLFYGYVAFKARRLLPDGGQMDIITFVLFSFWGNIYDILKIMRTEK